MLKIITDNASDIPLSTIEKYKIEVLPIAIMDGENEYFIGENINTEKLINNMKNGVVYKTSQVTRALIYLTFEKFVKEGFDVIYLPLSSGISGTFDNALGARNDILEKYPKANIAVIDSKSATMGQGIITIKAAMMASKGMEFNKIVEKIKYIVKTQVHLFTVGNLEYLYRGGRLSKTSKVLGGLLNIMPLLFIEREEGKIIPIDKARGKKAFFKILQKNINNLSKDNKFDPNQSIVICPADWDEMAKDVKKFFIENMNVSEENIHIEELGCIITSHTGPETLTLFFSSDPGEENIIEM